MSRSLMFCRWAVRRKPAMCGAPTFCRIGVTPDRQPGRTIIVSVLDNLVKGASGQAIQCANIALGLPEVMGLEAAPMFP